MPRSILIADDSVTIRRVVELAFSDTDVRVESAGSGAEAIAKFSMLNPDVVLADVVMPEPSGYDVCRSVKSSSRPVPVLLLAGTFEPFDPERARGCGADGHLVKPFDSRTLVAQVMRLLELPPLASRRDAATVAAFPSYAARDTVSVPAPAEDDLDAVFNDLAGVAPLVSTALTAVEPAPAESVPPAPAERIEFASAERRELAPAERIALVTPAEPEAPMALPPSSSAMSAARGPLAEDEIEALATRVVERLTDRVLREIAWDVVPDLAEAVIRERLRQLDRDDGDR